MDDLDQLLEGPRPFRAPARKSPSTRRSCGRRAAEVTADGPEELHVVLLDNGRSRMLAGETAEILACIRCGACLNACPVYRTDWRPRLRRHLSGRWAPSSHQACAA